MEIEWWCPTSVVSRVMSNEWMSDEWWCQTGVVFRVMSDEWWVMEIEWWKLSDEKKQTKQGLSFCLVDEIIYIYIYKYKLYGTKC